MKIFKRNHKHNNNQKQDKNDKHKHHQQQHHHNQQQNINNIFDDGFIVDIMSYLIMIIYILICPFTKVEESFNVQAMHDMCYIGVDRDALNKYDHLEFPGVIPRTFIGSLVVSFFSKPIILTITDVYWRFFSKQVSKLIGLYVVRSVLAFLSFLALSQFRRAISSKFGKDTGIWFILITCSQFHLLFYMSRPLPNIFALVIVLYAYSFWLKNRLLSMVALLTVAIFVFRSEVMILAGPIVLTVLIQRQLKFADFVGVGILSAVFAVGVSVTVDSYFWKQWLYPEGEVFLFNTVENKSSEWGTSPFHWYFSSALPRSLVACLFFIPLGLYYERARLLPYLTPILAFVGLYSLLPHKELRFIFYSIPIFNFVGSVGISRVFRRAFSNSKSTKKGVGYRLLALLIIAMLLCNFLLSLGYVYVSSKNYPGGYSLVKLHSELGITNGNGFLVNYLLLEEIKNMQHNTAPLFSAHIDNLAAISGASRFGEFNEFFSYSKKERDVDLTHYTHLIAPNCSSESIGFKKVNTIDAFTSISFSKHFPFIQINEKQTLFILSK
ncbi:hypothetical protein CYY_004316 [Polysphondylium violaceum]|uniref:Mannosyltransferase n=1 Tax=Polysphondylium violaceum TaxID=133409 RepID=A0A8J4PWX6_9MYCE|nr:hypothetical protein CYY_004316 [Polysphondylium violaceum]